MIDVAIHKDCSVFLFARYVWHICFSVVVGNRESLLASIGIVATLYEFHYKCRKPSALQRIGFALVGKNPEPSFLGSIPNPHITKSKGALRYG